MDLKKITSLLKRVGLSLAVAGTLMYATTGCDITNTLKELVNGLVSSAGA